MNCHSVLPVIRLGRALPALVATAFLVAACDRDDSPPLPEESGTTFVDVATLYDRSWLVDEIEGSGVNKDLDSGILVGTDGSITGRAGCNFLSGEAELSGENLTFSTLITTKRACPEPVMQQEDRFLAALGRVSQWRIVDERLQLMDANEQILLQFSAAQ